MKIDLRLTNGRIFYDGNVIEGDLEVSNGKIFSIGENRTSEAEKVVDLDKKLVLPGIIDEHVHFRDPGYTHKANFKTESKAAAVGGITTVFEMPNTKPPVTNVQRFEEKKEIIDQKSFIDYALFAQIDQESVETTDIKELDEKGVIGYKIFMIPSGGGKDAIPHLGKIYSAMKKVKRTNKPLLFHTEKNELLEKFTEEAKNKDKSKLSYHMASRPPIVEELAAMELIKMNSEVGGKLLLPHSSSKGVVESACRSRSEGNKVYVETAPQYLLLTEDGLKDKGPFYKFNPPARSEEHVKFLWNGIKNGFIQTIGSDHAPHAEEEKEAGLEDISKAPGGAPGTEHMLSLMFTQVNEDKLTLEELVRLMSRNPSKLYGLFPNKGSLIPGTDADITIIDPDKEETIDPEKMYSNQKYTPFEGHEVKGVPEMTIVRGEIVMKDRKIQQGPGYGKYISP